MDEISNVSRDTLPTPGWLGRAIRIILGIIVLWGASGIVASFNQLVTITHFPANVELWLFAGLLFFAMQDVIDLGLGVQWGQIPRIVTLLLAGICIIADYILYARLWAPPLAIFFAIWCLVISIPLGIALILTGIVSLPGCEMRVYAALIAKMQGRSATEHYCRGGVDFVDRWEKRK